MRRALESFPADVTPLRVLAVPCGLPRDLTDLSDHLRQDNPDLLRRVEYHGMDIDDHLLQLAAEFATAALVAVKLFHQGNALLAETFPPGPFHFVMSTGLIEFLDAAQLEVFLGHVYERLAPGGTFYTSATRKEQRSDALMRAFELITRYRSLDELETVLGRFPWRRLKLVQDETGLQTFAVGVK
jgi:2-polyprenyl-3-methyl-5-hydroxy-6-metoxy-1,4-benzoquinol methylase